MDFKLAKVYYSTKGYWKGIAAVKELAEAAKILEETAKQWLIKQALWQIHLPAPRYIPRPKFDVSTTDAVHHADLYFLPHNKHPRGHKVSKYALTVVEVEPNSTEALSHSLFNSKLSPICGIFRECDAFIQFITS